MTRVIQKFGKRNFLRTKEDNLSRFAEKNLWNNWRFYFNIRYKSNISFGKSLRAKLYGWWIQQGGWTKNGQKMPYYTLKGPSPLKCNINIVKENRIFSNWWPLDKRCALLAEIHLSNWNFELLTNSLCSCASLGDFSNFCVLWTPNTFHHFLSNMIWASSVGKHWKSAKFFHFPLRKKAAKKCKQEKHLGKLFSRFFFLGKLNRKSRPLCWSCKPTFTTFTWNNFVKITKRSIWTIYSISIDG